MESWLANWLNIWPQVAESGGQLSARGARRTNRELGRHFNHNFYDRALTADTGNYLIGGKGAHFMDNDTRANQTRRVAPNIN